MTEFEIFPTSEQKTCPKCGQSFNCGRLQHDQELCWCAALPQVEPIEDGTDCRCPSCLAIEAHHRRASQR